MFEKLQKRIDAFKKKPESAEKARNAQIVATAIFNMNAGIALDLNPPEKLMSDEGESPDDSQNSSENPKLV